MTRTTGGSRLFRVFIFTTFSEAGVRGKPLKYKSIEFAIKSLEKKSESGKLRVERQAFRDVTTLLHQDGQWLRSQAHSDFHLLREMSKRGEVSATLSAQFQECKNNLKILRKRGFTLENDTTY